MKQHIKDDYPIDLVITWVDGRDPAWKKEKEKYVSPIELSNKDSGGDERYVDDGLLNYIFRGIEKFLPWINTIHFVTCGHLPPWLNTTNPKLHIVKHSDFMPNEFLPTFNANPIILNLHRIPGLAEHFIYLNDDFYFINHLKRTDFFKKGLPRDMACLETIDAYSYLDTFEYILHNNIALLNHMFDKKKVVKKNVTKWFNIKYGFKHNYKTYVLSKFRLFTGIYEPHIPIPFLKSSFEIVWEKLHETLLKVCRNRVRSYTDITEYLVRYYQLASGNFIPINRDKLGTYRVMSSIDLPSIISNQKKRMVCINYPSSLEDLENVKKQFDVILGNKSSFELF